MKSFISYLGLALFLLPMTLKSQTSEQSITFESAFENNGFVELTLTSNNRFIIGANRYVLHGGGKFFARSTHPDGDEFKLTFFIPLDEFTAINGLNDLVLVYGLYESNKKQDGEGDQSNGFEGPQWKVNGTIIVNQK